MIKPIAFVLAAAIVTAAYADDAAKLKQSLGTWQKLKQQCGGNYQYNVSFSSFAGFGHTTTIVVKNNKVAERHYRVFSGRPIAPALPGQLGKPQDDKWVERGKDLGSHKKGAPLKTLDDLYAEAADVVKRELPQHQRRYLRFDKQGLLNSCFTVDTRIADDAPTKGASINNIKLEGGAAGNAKAAKMPATLSDGNNGQSFTMRRGQKVTINLRANATTGFEWFNATKPGAIRLLGKVAYAAAPKDAPDGAPGVAFATFVAVKSGKGSIVLQYKQSARGKKAARTFTVNVVVGNNAPGNTGGKVFKAPNGKAFPAHWGRPPLRQTRDLRPLPGGYGRGSGTLARWIGENIKKDAAKN